MKHSKSRIVLIGLSLILCTIWIYYLGRIKPAYFQLYYIPILLSAYSYGIVGGIGAAAVINLLYYFSIFYGNNLELDNIDVFLAPAFFSLVGLFTGLLSSRNVRIRNQLKQRVSQLYTLAQVRQVISSTLNLDKILSVIMDEVTTVMDSKIASIMLLDKEKQELTIKAAKGLSKETIQNTRVKVGERISGWVAKHREPLLIKNLEDDPRFSVRTNEKYYTSSLLAVPIESKGEVIGVVNVNNKASKEIYTEDDLKLLIAIAFQSAVAIDNAQTYENLNNLYLGIIDTLAEAIDAKDHYTRNHSEHVTKYALAIARELKLPQCQIEIIGKACRLHDIGKIGINDSILTKPGKLTDEEFIEIKKHPAIGANILSPLEFLDDVVEMVRQHHEKMDGTGYPDNKKGDDIPLGARIIGVADSFDAMTSDRPYRKALSLQTAVNELRKNAGSQFDASVVDAFLRVLERNQFQEYIQAT